MDYVHVLVFSDVVKLFIRKLNNNNNNNNNNWTATHKTTTDNSHIRHCTQLYFGMYWTTKPTKGSNPAEDMVVLLLCLSYFV